MKSLSHVWLFATPWTTAYQAPLSVGFSRQEYWNGLLLPSLFDLYSSLNLTFLLSLLCVQLLFCVQSFMTLWTVAQNFQHLWDFSGKNSGMACHFLLQGIFQTDPVIKSVSSVSPAFVGRSFTAEPSGLTSIVRLIVFCFLYFNLNRILR